MLETIPETIDGLPNLSGNEALVRAAMQRPRARRLPASGISFDSVQAGFACALHMHQPLVPAGGSEIQTARIISNLKHMLDNPQVGDNHNAPVFRWCYRRPGELIPQLVSEGKRPRIMLEYSGTLLHGLCDMGASDVLDALRLVTHHPDCAGCIEWLGTSWGHAVAPSTPIQDYRLHVEAFQHHFAAIFGLDALERLQGFSPSEMALPNHPDVAYAFVKTLRDCHYRWVLVQEHTVERLEDGAGPREKHLPHRLVVRSSEGAEASIVAIIKTQGSDTKLVGQMQPYYEARELGRADLAGRSVPRLVTQIADGENGGVMMNEFPPRYLEVMREASGSRTPAVNVSEYLEYLDQLGVGEQDLPAIQPIFQKRIWERYQAGSGPEKLARAIEDLKREDHRFHVDGGSWTNNISWVRGYANVLRPMERASALFHENVLGRGISPSDPRYRSALFHLLTAETSCYRYWGEGIWADYGRELARRAGEIAAGEG